jgi:hypothetical protein
MKRVVDNGVSDTLWSSHVAIGTTFPWFCFHALEVPIHIHVEILWAVF